VIDCGGDIGDRSFQRFVPSPSTQAGARVQANLLTLLGAAGDVNPNSIEAHESPRSAAENSDEVIVLLSLAHHEELPLDRFVRPQPKLLVRHATIVDIDSSTANQPRGLAF
jgi:hypothetical protein